VSGFEISVGMTGILRALKVPMQYPLVLLVRVGSRQVKALVCVHFYGYAAEGS
jgi:hypothetical protein